RIPPELRAQRRYSPDAMWCVQREMQRDVSAHAVAEEIRAVDSLTIEDLDHVLGEMSNAKVPAARRRVPMAFEVQCVDSNGTVERGDECAELRARAERTVE